MFSTTLLFMIFTPDITVRAGFCGMSWSGGIGQELCPAPWYGQDYNNYLDQLKAYKSSARSQSGFNGDQYLQVNWTATNIVHAQVHPYDRYIYDRDSHEYTVKKYVDYTRQRYGGVDSILLWPTYTQIGVDDRNQYDLHRVLPGGKKALKKMIEEFHSLGVKVLLPYNPWDYLSRDERVSDAEALDSLIIDVGADGFNGDTLGTIPREFWDYAVSRGAYLAMEPEAYGSMSDVSFITLGWGYYFSGWDCVANELGQGTCYDSIPGVDRMKIIDGRRMTHVTDRWLVDKIVPLQIAYFNANGFNVWENVWGVYNNVTDRDAEVIRRTSHILRYFSQSGHTTIGVPDWQPHYPTTASNSHVHSSMFRLRRDAWGGDTQLVLFINFSDEPVSGIGFDLHWWKVNHIYDCWSGKSLANSSQLSLSLEARGFGCIFASESEPPKERGFAEFLSERQKMTMQPISQFSKDFQGLQQQMREMPSAIASDASGMVLIPKTTFDFKASGLEIEGTNLWVDFQFPWELMPNRYHSQSMTIGPFYMDKHPVTNAQFSAFIKSSGYQPRDPTNFLKHWITWTSAQDLNCWPNGDSTTDNSNGAIYDRCCPQNDYFWVSDLAECQRICMTTNGCNCVTMGQNKCFLRKDCVFSNCQDSNGAYQSSSGKFSLSVPESLGNTPVVYVSYAEAEAYCKWAGKRLPHSYEWQLAAQGTDGRPFPWGWGDDTWRRPTATSERHLGPFVEVGKFSSGQSPYGVEDMFQHVWEYTDVFTDEHSIAVLLKGGSTYQPCKKMGSSRCWYFQQSQPWHPEQPINVGQHNKYFLMDDSFERAGSLGFRCVSDTAESPPAPFHFKASEKIQGRRVKA